MAINIRPEELLRNMLEVDPAEVTAWVKKEIDQRGHVDLREIAARFRIPEAAAVAVCMSLGLVKHPEMPGHYITVETRDNPYLASSLSRLGEYPSRWTGNFVSPEPESNGRRPEPDPVVSLGDWVSRQGATELRRLSAELNDEAEADADESVKEAIKPPVEFSSVVLEPDKKTQILAAISQIKNKELIFTTWGFSEVFEKGTAISLLFYGIPGTGKTLMAQAIADHLKFKLKVYGTAEIESSEPGGAERAIKNIFKEASAKVGKKTEQVILFDECDSLLSSRQQMGAIMAAQVNTLLSEIEHYAGLVIFTTNRLGRLDPALERRIAAKIEFAFPTVDMREQIWLRLIPKKAPIDSDVDFKKLAKIPIAGGNIKNAVLNAARMAAFEQSKVIKKSHFKTAVEKELTSLQDFEKHDDHTGQADYASGTGDKTITKHSQEDSLYAN